MFILDHVSINLTKHFYYKVHLLELSDTSHGLAIESGGYILTPKYNLSSHKYGIKLNKELNLQNN